MDKREEAQAQDLILKYILDNRYHTFQGSSIERLFQPSDFYSSFFNKKLDRKYIDRLIEKIITYELGGNVIVKWQDNLIFGCNHLTEEFLKNGGFLQVYEGKIAAEREYLEDATKERDRKALEWENLKLTNKLNQQKLKTHYFPIIISLLGLAIAIASYFRPSNNSAIEEMNTQVRSLEKNLQDVQKEFKEENKELKERLYKAEDE